MKSTAQILGVVLGATLAVGCQPTELSTGKARSVAGRGSQLKLAPGAEVEGRWGEAAAQVTVAGSVLHGAYGQGCAGAGVAGSSWAMGIDGSESNDVRVVRGDSACQLIARQIVRTLNGADGQQWVDTYTFRDPADLGADKDLVIGDGFDQGRLVYAWRTSSNWNGPDGGTLLNISGAGMDFMSSGYDVTVLSGKTAEDVNAAAHSAMYDYSQVASVSSSELDPSDYRLSSGDALILTDINDTITQVEGSFRLEAGAIAGDVYVIGAPTADFESRFPLRDDAQRYAVFKALVDDGGPLGQQSVDHVDIAAAELFPVGTNIRGTHHNYVLVRRVDDQGSGVESFQLLGITISTATAIAPYRMDAR